VDTISTFEQLRARIDAVPKADDVTTQSHMLCIPVAHKETIFDLPELCVSGRFEYMHPLKAHALNWFGYTVFWVVGDEWKYVPKSEAVYAAEYKMGLVGKFDDAQIDALCDMQAQNGNERFYTLVKEATADNWHELQWW
jgi:hypothetical protein